MDVTLEAAIQSYFAGSLFPLRENVSNEKLSSILELFKDIVKEVDDSHKPITHCQGMKSYSKAQENTRNFLQDLLCRLNKPLDALEVIDVLEKWGVMAPHENVVIWKENLEFRKRFSQDVKKAAATLLHTATKHPLDVTGRRDFTGALSFAIDKSSTRDADDAISCDPTSNTVFVHITAPAEYVRNQRYHIVMKEATRRLLSIYSGQERLPIFPDEIASNLFSLKRGSHSVRYTTTFRFQITQDGAISQESMYVCASVISRPVCLSYRKVAEILHRPDHCHHRAIKLLENLAGLRRKWRYSRGRALQYAEHAKKTQHEAAHLIVEEMMISANTVAAKYARSRGIPVLYRGVSGGNRYAVSSDEYSTFHGTKYTCSMYASGTMQRDMEKGANVQLDIRPLQHVGLGLEEYVQATSPIRKFSDLIFHCQFNASTRKQPLPFSEKYLLETKDKIMELEKASARIERRAKKYWAYERLRKDGPKIHKGVLRSQRLERNKGHSRFSRSHLLKKLTHRREESNEWVVFLKDVECEITASVPFWGRIGMQVGVQVREVNPRTSHLIASVTSR